jgi:gas vesicle protein
MRTNANFIYTVLAGAAVGAIIGYLFTTDKGKEFRGDVMDTARNLGSTISDRVMEGVDIITEKTSDVRGNFRNSVDDIAENIKGGFDKVKSKGSQYVGRNH